MTRFLTSALLAAAVTGAAAADAGAGPDIPNWLRRCQYLYETIDDPHTSTLNEETTKSKIVYSSEWHKIENGDENLRKRLVREYEVCRLQGNQGLKNRAEYAIMMIKQIGLEHCLTLAPSDAKWNAHLRWWVPDNASAADKKKTVAKMRKCINTADSWTYAGQPRWKVQRTKEFAKAVIAKASAGAKPAPRPAPRPEDRRKERPEEQRRREEEEARRRTSGESTEDAKPTEGKPTEETPTQDGATTENKATEDAKQGSKAPDQAPVAGTEDATAVCAALKGKTAEELKALVPEEATDEKRKAIAATYEPCLKVDDAEISKNAQTVIDAATKGDKCEDSGSNVGLIVGLVVAALALVTAVVVLILCCCTGTQEADAALDSP